MGCWTVLLAPHAVLSSTEDEDLPRVLRDVHPRSLHATVSGIVGGVVWAVRPECEGNKDNGGTCQLVVRVY